MLALVLLQQGNPSERVAIRHPEKVRKVVSISAVFRHDGWVDEVLTVFPQFTADALKGSSIEAEYKRLSPTPDEFPNFVGRVIAMDLKPYDFGADRLESTPAPFLFIHGDADGVRLDHIAETFRIKGDEIMGDLRPRSESRLSVLPNTTHVTLMEKGDVSSRGSTGPSERTRRPGTREGSRPRHSPPDRAGGRLPGPPRG